MRTPRPKKPAGLPWHCRNCGKVTNPGYRQHCQLCNAPRPSEQYRVEHS